MERNIQSYLAQVHRVSGGGHLGGEDAAFPRPHRWLVAELKLTCSASCSVANKGPNMSNGSNSRVAVGDKVHCLVYLRRTTSESVRLFLLDFFFSRTFP